MTAGGDFSRQPNSSSDSKHFELRDVSTGEVSQAPTSMLSAKMFLPPRSTRQDYDDDERSRRGSFSAPPSAPPSAPGSPTLGPRGRSAQMVRDEEPLLSGSARAVSVSRLPLDSEKQQVRGQSGGRDKSRYGRAVAFAPDGVHILTHVLFRLLLGLSAMAAVLLLFNILQIALLEYVSSVAWVVGAPLIALALMSIALGLCTVRRRADLTAGWKGANGASNATSHCPLNVAPKC